MADLQYTVNLDAAQALAALRQLQAELSKDILQGRIKGLDVSDLEKQLAKVNSSISGMGFGKRFSAEMTGMLQQVPVLGRVFNALNGAAGAASGALAVVTLAIAGAKKALTEWAALETSLMSLNASMAATGQLSRDNALAASRLAEEYGKLTGTGTEPWLDSLGKLIRLGGRNVEQLEESAAAVKNLAGLTGADLSTATMLYIRALNGSTEQLSRYGIKLTETLSPAEKLAELHQKLGQGSGLMEAQTKTLSGSLSAFKDSVGDLFKAFGAILDRGYKIREWFQWWTDKIRSFTGKLPSPEPDLENLNNAVGVLKTTEAVLQKLGVSAAALDLSRPADQAKTAYEQLNDEISKSLERQDKLRQAALALRLSELDVEESKLDPGLPPEERARKKAQIDIQRAVLTGNTNVEAAQARVEAAEKLRAPIAEAQQALSKKAAEIQARRDSDLPTLDGAKARAAELNVSVKDRNRYLSLEVERDKILAQAEAGDQDRLAEIEKELKPLRQRLAAYNQAVAIAAAVQTRINTSNAELAAVTEALTQIESKKADADTAVTLANKQLETERNKAAAATERAKQDAAEQTQKASAEKIKSTRDTAVLKAETAEITAETPEQKKKAVAAKYDAQIATIREENDPDQKPEAKAERQARREKLEAERKRDLAAIDADEEQKREQANQQRGQAARAAGSAFQIDNLARIGLAVGHQVPGGTHDIQKDILRTLREIKTEVARGNRPTSEAGQV
jgi:hypothetical protein